MLFRADLDGEEIDKKFRDVNCSLKRYFDLDEDTKEKLYLLKKSCEDKNRKVSVYYEDDIKEINSIIQLLKDHQKYRFGQ